MQRELERKFSLSTEHVSVVINWLEQYAIAEGVIEQVDTYFNLSSQEDVSGYRSLRIRQSGQQAWLCCKIKRFDEHGNFLYCDEIETSLGSAQAGHALFEALGFVIDVVVKKERRYYRYDMWHIAVDLVGQLGWFLEIELQGNDAMSVSQAEQEINALIAVIGLPALMPISSGYRMLVKKHQGS